MLMIDSLLRHLSQDEIQARNLTKPSDKLPALDGIAQQLSRRRPNVQYLAGLWSDTLAQDMLWEINTRGTGKPYSCKQLSTAYRAPSWSWAAVEDAVLFPSDALKSEKLVSILECSCEYVDSNPFNEVRSGQLRSVGQFINAGQTFSTETGHLPDGLAHHRPKIPNSFKMQT